MNHANHAPERGHHPLKAPVDGRVEANFAYVRVVQPDGSSSTLETTVPLDFTTGVTSQLRVYRETADQVIPSLDYQLVPDGAPVSPSVPDQSPADDPLYLKNSYVGTITVNVPGREPRRFFVTIGPGEDAVRLDLTKGLNVKCWFDLASVHSHPIGPMLNIDVTAEP